MSQPTVHATPVAAARQSARHSPLSKYDETPARDWDGSHAPSIYDLLAHELVAPSALWESTLDLSLDLEGV